MISIQIPRHLIRFPFALVATSLLVLFSACGGGGEGGSQTAETKTETGSLLFSLAISPDAGVRLQRQGFDCQAFNIQFIEAIVFDANDVVVAIGGPWACEDRQGTIQAVPVGDNYEVVIDAIGPEGEVLFSGSVEGISVLPNQTTDAGIILLLPVVNLPPILSPIGNQTVPAGVPLVLELEASDPNEGDILTFGVGDLPPGAFFDPESGRFDWTPSLDQEGNFPVTFSVTDNGVPPLGDSEEIIITVGPGNQPPVIAPIEDITAVVGELIEFTVIASDPDPGDTLTLSVQGGLPQSATFDPETGFFQWLIAESDIGVRDISFAAVDSGIPPLSDTETVRFFIESGNAPPVFTQLGDQQVEEGEELIFVVTATDPDGDPLTFTRGELPEGAGFDPETQTFFWTPDFGDAGNYSAEFTVTDSGTPPLSDTLVVPITVGDVNRPPVFTPVEPIEAPVQEPFELVLSATDPDGDNLTFEAENLPEGAEFDPEVPRFQWTPPELLEAPITVFFAVTDDGTPNLSDELTVEITVISDNLPPILSPIGNRSIAPDPEFGAILSFPVQATDPNDDFLTFTGSGIPFGRGAFLAGSNTPNREVFNWQVFPSDAGTYTATFTVTDDGIPPASDSETIVITVETTNLPPILDPIGDQTVPQDGDFGGFLGFSITATDPEGTLLTFDGSGLPFQLGAALEPGEFDNERFFAWDASNVGPGDYSTTFSVTDGGNPSASDFETIIITVGASNQPPVLDPIGNRTIVLDPEFFTGSLSFTVTASDLDVNDQLTLEATGQPLLQGATFDPSTGLFSWAVTSEDVGTYTATFTVTDDGNPVLDDSETITIVVTF